MKILAVRLREVGPFINGVALEGLTGRLDVLAGPNELGKSTLFRALQTAFFESHATTSKDVERLRPYSGGAPLIEVDFATQEGVWRIRKQFLASKSATLIDLASNRVAARGKEAEARLNELIGMSEGKRGDFGRFALLWVAQMASLGETKAEGAAASALHAAIGREVETVAGGASARQIRDRVQSELSELITPKTGKPTGRFAEARTEHDRLSAELRDAEEAEQRARTRVARLETLRAQRNALADPAALARLTETVSASGSAHEAGKQAAQALQLANARLKSTEQAVSEAQRILDAFDRAVGEEAALTEAVRTEEAQLAAGADMASEARIRRDDLLARAAAARRAERLGRLAAHRQTSAEVTTLEAELRELERQLKMNGATREALGKIEAEDRAILDLTARLSAAAPMIRFEYRDGVAEGFRVAGRSISAGAEVRAVDPVAIEIAGIGRITVTPGSLADRDDMAADLAAHQEELAHVLASLGVDHVAAARAHAEARRALDDEFRAKSARRQSLAPAGLARLNEVVAQLDAELSRDGVAVGPDAGAIAAPEAGQTAAAYVSEADIREAQAKSEAADQEAMRLKTLIGERHRQLAALAERLPAGAERAARHAELRKLREAAEADVNETSRAKSAWAETAPTLAGLAALETSWQAAQTALAASHRQLHRIELDIRGEEAALAQAGEAGTGLRRLELEGEVVRAGERLAAFEAESASLTLLKDALDAAAASVRDRFLLPVETRLEPYLRLVFPGSRLNLGAGFSVAGMARAAAEEQLAALSIGTREQLAVLVRLGFGKLFAETGLPAPVVLDDALVYSDDERIGRVFEALRLAAASHQVIVLTCRAAAFAPLGGCRLSFVPWEPMASAA